ncbi:MAG TPA: hypothetical protein VLI04_14850 [Nocardioidaceae bacterium]|nr:hypothetical protein [Nocardioidaceae bacterium]
MKIEAQNLTNNSRIANYSDGKAAQIEGVIHDRLANVVIVTVRHPKTNVMEPIVFRPTETVTVS